MLIKVLGSCSGTEPMPDRHHVSWLLDTGDGIYWFDAGECCSYRAHIDGISILNIRALFISHTHMDHVGGLPELMWTLRKLEYRSGQPKPYGGFDIFIPEMDPLDGALKMLKHTMSRKTFEIRPHLVPDGVFFDDGRVQVEAKGNMHIGDPALSKSYRIRHNGKTIIYSGDVKDISELADWLDDPCDLMFMETGHHAVQAVCDYIAACPAVQRLWFIHHGCDILYHTDACRQLAASILGDRVHIADDGDELVL